ncbi:uncharacterized protein [Onthophagus taurus]|uniref:uncharacterized protein n=1 Tax=Onthophagus taurus TaxID=166361 RepID=UPI000C1FD919|nr:uncharacterized protein LOC111415289 [Onthophagus taurus]
MSQRKINILLLGETGVGKTTFINMLTKYLLGSTWSDVASDDFTVLAPITFTHINENFEENQVNVGIPNENEITTPGASSTQKPRSYIYHLSDDVILNVVDTPGIGDTKGLDFDLNNTHTMLRYISELEYINAVCIFLKPTDSRLSVIFDRCLRVILKELVPNIRNNFAFVFTRTRGTHYGPGDAYPLLRTAIEEIQNITGYAIPLGKHNVFCLDNEAFRYLSGRHLGLKFSEAEISRYSESFNHSTSTTKRMIDFIKNLPQIKMQNVATPNESKRIILRLSKPLTTLIGNYEKALISIKQYEEALNSKSTNLDLLKQNLFKIDHKQLIRSQTTTGRSTSHKVGFGIHASFPVFSIGGNLDYNYSEDTSNQKVEMVDFVEQRVLDRDIYSLITDETSANIVIQKKIAEMEIICDEYKAEVNVILDALATFYVYCKENELIHDDPFLKEFIAIKEEAALDDKQLVADELEKIIKKYEIKKNNKEYIRPVDIKEVALRLFELKHSGETFKGIMNKKFEFLSIEMNTKN